MCLELKNNINKKIGNNIKEEQIPEVVKMVMEYVNIDKIERGGVPIVEVLKKMGFRVYKDNFQNKSLSAFITIDPKYKDEFGTNKIVCVNSNDNIGHERFALAHELAHYLFDFDEMKTVSYYNTYIADDEFNSENPIERRANYFAACLLMPEDNFRKKEEELSGEISKADIVNELASFFGVSVQAVMRRFRELKIEGYEQ